MTSEGGAVKNLIKKITIVALGIVAFLEVNLLLLSLIYAPYLLTSLVDFRPRPPYLPFSATFAAGQMPHATTVYFVVPEDDILVTLHLRRREKNPKTGLWEPVTLINESDQLKIELWTVRNGREESVFSDSVKPRDSSMAYVRFPVPPKKNEIYRLQVINSRASPTLAALSEMDFWLIQRSK